MSHQISLWVGLIGIVATVPLIQPAIAKTSVTSGKTTGSSAVVANKLNHHNLQSALIAQKISPKAEEYLKSAMQKASKKDYQGGLADINRAIQLSPNYAGAYSVRGNLKGILQDDDGALADFNRAIQLNPKAANAYTGRGTIKMSQKDYDGALADLNRAIQLNPKDADVAANAYKNRAILKYGFLKNRSGGIADLQQAIKLYQKQGNQKEVQVDTIELKKWQKAGSV